VVVGVTAGAVAVDVDEAGNHPRTPQIDALCGIRGLARADRRDRVTLEQQPAVGAFAALVGEQCGMQQRRHGSSLEGWWSRYTALRGALDQRGWRSRVALDQRGAEPYLKMMVRAPSSSTRSSANHVTAWVRVRLSSSWPIATSSAGVRVWSTRTTFCSMMGPSSRSLVTKCAVAPMSFTPRACACL